MKFSQKAILIAALFLLSIQSFAQGQWQVKAPSQDPMLADKSGYSFVWMDQDKNSATLICKKGEDSPESITKLYIQSFQGIFCLNGLYKEKVKIGVYKDGKLEKHWKVKGKGNRYGDNLAIQVQGKLRRYLLDPEVNVRIVAKKYNEDPFDMTLPTLFDNIAR